MLCQCPAKRREADSSLPGYTYRTFLPSIIQAQAFLKPSHFANWHKECATRTWNAAIQFAVYSSKFANILESNAIWKKPRCGIKRRRNRATRRACLTSACAITKAKGSKSTRLPRSNGSRARRRSVTKERSPFLKRWGFEHIAVDSVETMTVRRGGPSE